MGHDVHFLSRLARLNDGDVETALALYRTPHIVDAVITRKQLGPEHDRIALALSREPGGPHIVVARDGAFVTCLGPGMSTGTLPIIFRGTLDAVMERRENLALADSLVGKKHGGGQILKRLNQHHTLSREEFKAMSAYAPAIMPTLFDTWMKGVERLELSYQATLRRNGVGHAERRKHWASLFRVGHELALIGTWARELFETLPEEAQTIADLFVWPLLKYGNVPTMLRGLSAIAPLGKSRLAALRHNQEPFSRQYDVLGHVLEAAVLGLSQRKLEAEARKLLARTHACTTPELTAYRASCVEAALATMDDAEQELKNFRAHGARIIVSCGRDLPRGHVYRYERAEDVPPDLGDSAAFLNLSHLSDSGMAMLFRGLPFVARNEPASFYLPQAALDALGLRDLLDHAVPKLVEDQRRVRPKPEPVQAEQKPERNEPCPCGSGKKYKKCCGR